MALRLRRGTDAERLSITPLEGELIYATDTKELYVGDGSTQGGVLVSANLADDTAPTLSANLDLNGNNIVGTGNININGTITATGTVNLGDGVEDNVIVGGAIGSSLTPNATDSFNLGDSLARWNSLHAVSLNAESAEINGEISVGSLVTDGSIVKSDSTVIYDGVSGDFTTNGVISAAAFKGTLVGDDSTVLVDGIGGVVSNGKLVLDGDVITGITRAYDFDNTLAPYEPIVAFGTRNDPQVMLIDGNNFPVIVRGVADELEGSNLTIQASRFSGTTNSTILNGDFLGQVVFEGYNGTEFKKASVISSQVASSVTAGEFDTNLQVSVLNSDGLYRQFMFKSDGTFDAGLGLSVYAANETELSGFSAIANTGLTGFGSERSAPVFFDGTAFRTVTSVVDVPSGPTATGKAGQIAGDADYVYFCYATDSWVRVAKDGTW